MQTPLISGIIFRFAFLWCSEVRTAEALYSKPSNLQISKPPTYNVFPFMATEIDYGNLFKKEHEFYRTQQQPRLMVGANLGNLLIPLLLLAVITNMNSSS